MNYLTKRILTSIMLIFIVYLSLSNLILLFLLLIILNLLAISEFNLIFKNIFKHNKFLIFSSVFFSVFYLTLFSVIIWIHLLSLEYTQIISLVLILTICVSSDIGGFVFGKLIGGKKLTKISPNKTYSGVLGSFLFALLFGYLIFYFQRNFLLFNLDILLIIFIVSIISQIGDLIISFLKRKAKIKDTGVILPGHGGILDRIDGILLGLPLGLALISF